MAVKIPSFADVGFDNPRPSTRLPQYPAEDPGAAALGQFGKGLSQFGGVLIEAEADQRRKQNQVNAALAEADLEANLFRTKEAIKNERDPAKVDELKGQLNGFLDRAGATITDPEARTLWAAKHKLKVVEAEGLADKQQRSIYFDRFKAGANQQLDEQIKISSQANDPEAAEAAKRRIGQIIGSLQESGAITAEQAQAATRELGEKIIVGRADWLSANGRYGEAQAHLRENAPHVDPTKLRTATDYLRPRVDKEIGLELLDRTARRAPPLPEEGGKRHINYGGTGALGDPRSPGWEAENLTSVSSPSGARFKVHKAAAADFAGFLKDLEATGYQIRPEKSGGHNLREMRGGGGQLSEHAYGTAIDINSDSNLYTRDGRKVTDLPPSVAALADKYNLDWGGNWKDPVDTMHFQWRGPRSGATADNNFGGIRKRGVIATKADGGFETYASPEAGVQAISDNLDRYASGVATAMNPDGKPITTLRGIVSTWAPPKENDTPALIARAAQVTGFDPDQPLDLADPSVKAKLIEATIRNEQGGKLPVARSLITKVAERRGAPTEEELANAPAVGEPIPLDEAPRAPGVPDWQGWLRRIDAAPGYTREQKEVAKAELRHRHNEFSLGQAEAASDLTLAIGRGEKGREDIEAAYQAGRISPEKRTALHAYFDKIDADRAALAEGMARVGAAGNGGAPLDPKSKPDRDALNFHYDAVSKGWPQDQALDRAVEYARQYGMVPQKLQAMVRGGLHSGRPDQAVLAADTVNRLRNANPQLIAEIGDENDMRLATLILSNSHKGMPPELAVKSAIEGLKVDKTTRDARAEDFDAQRGKTDRDRDASDKKWIEGKQNTLWSIDPTVEPRMRAEFEALTKDEFVRTGDLEASRTRALDTINRVWGRTRVGSGGSVRYERHAPEKFYGAPTLSPDDNSAWMNEQLIEDVSRGAMVGKPVTVDRLLLAPSEKPAPDGRPAYEVMLLGDNGYERVFRWVPNWETSAEYKRRQEGRARKIEEFREMRANPKPPWDFLLRGGATLQEQMSRGAGEQ